MAGKPLRSGGHRPGAGRKRRLLRQYEERETLKAILGDIGGPRAAFGKLFETLCSNDGKPKEKLAALYSDNLHYLCDHLWGRSKAKDEQQRDDVPVAIILDV